MSLDFLNLPDWLTHLFAIGSGIAAPLFTILSGIIILILVAVIKKKTDDKVKEYKQLIDVLQQLNGKEDPTGKITELQNRLNDMNNSFLVVTNALEVIFTNANLPQATRDKLATIFTHVKTKDYDALLIEAKEEAAKLKDEVEALRAKLAEQKQATVEDVTEVNVQRA